jgi:hypothetical protein
MKKTPFQKKLEFGINKMLWNTQMTGNALKEPPASTINP